MYKWKTSHGFMSNIVLLVLLLLLSVLLPLLHLTNYVAAVELTGVKIPASFNLRLIVLVGILINGSVALLINYHLLKVIYKVRKYPIAPRTLLSQYTVTTFVLACIDLFVKNTQIHFAWLVTQALIVTIVYLFVFIFYNKRYAIKNFQNGFFGTLIFSGIHLFLTLAGSGFLFL